MKLLPLALLGLALLASVSADEWQKPEFCKDWDCPRFKTENSEEDYDTRTYEAATWAYVAMEGVRNPDEACMEAFAHLFHYFDGENDKGEKIPMTTPVATNISIRHRHCRHHSVWGSEEDSSTAAGLWERLGLGRRRRRKDEKVDVTMKFYLPYAYQEGGDKEAPKPKDECVKVDTFPKWTAHVREFEGFPSQRRFMEHYEELVDALEDNEEDYSNDWAVFSIYNPPEDLENRHNEVLLPAEGGKKRSTMKPFGAIN